MQDSRKQFTKNNTSVEFIATTDFFIKNRITEEQIYSIHFAHLSVDDIHTKNQCEWMKLAIYGCLPVSVNAG